MVEQSAKMAHVAVHDTISGQREATWTTQGDEVHFRVRADPSQPADAVPVVMAWIRQHYAGFLDCRRRCEQGGISPEGDIEIQVAVDGRGRAKPTYGKITVTHPRARSCTEQLFKRTTFEHPTAPVNVQLNVQFAR
jgi:hypothetical protein